MNRQLISQALHKTLLPIIVISWILLIASFFIDISLESIGKELGEWAIYLLWIVSLPGILKRFRVKGFLQNIQIIFMQSRRRLGILMFTFALMHYAWLRLFLYIKLSVFPAPGESPPFETMGFLGLFLLIPLFITSNNRAVRILKKNWQRIHYLIYAAMWLIAFHVSLQGKLEYAIPTFAIIFLQITSWIQWKRTVPA